MAYGMGEDLRDTEAGIRKARLLLRKAFNAKHWYTCRKRVLQADQALLDGLTMIGESDYKLANGKKGKPWSTKE